MAAIGDLGQRAVRPTPASAAGEAASPNDVASSGLADLVASLQPRLRQAMAATYGPEIGHEAADEAVAWALAHPERINGAAYPLAYLYRVAQSKARPSLRWLARRAPSIDSDAIIAAHIAPVDPELVRALATLTPDHRIAVLLVHAHGWTIADVAEARGVPVSTVTNHLRRGLAKLRTILKENDQ